MFQEHTKDTRIHGIILSTKLKLHCAKPPTAHAIGSLAVVLVLKVALWV